MIKKYVLGFAFDSATEFVVLIEKLRPEWQAGFLNGVGGKIEESDKSYGDAMVREFEEETGVTTEVKDWHHFATMVFENDIMGGGAEVMCYRMFSDVVFECKTVEEEKIYIIPTDMLRSYRIIPNLKVLVPLALNQSIDYSKLITR